MWPCQRPEAQKQPQLVFRVRDAAFGRKKRHHTLLRFHGGAFLPGRRNERMGKAEALPIKVSEKSRPRRSFPPEHVFLRPRRSWKDAKGTLAAQGCEPTAPAAGFAMDSKDTEPLQTRIRRQKDLPEQAMRRQAMKGLISLSRSSQESV